MTGGVEGGLRASGRKRGEFDPEPILEVFAQGEHFFGEGDGFFGHGYADRTRYTDGAKGGTIGINWYLNEMVRIMLNYNHIEFDDYVREADDDDEDVFLARFALEF